MHFKCAVLPIVKLLALGVNVNTDSIVTWISMLQDKYPTVGLLLVLMMLDVLTGLFAGAIERKLNSRVSWTGMCKKVLMILAVGMGNALVPYASDVPLGKVIAVFYSFTEGISVIENLKRGGVPVPAILRSAIARFGTDVSPQSTKSDVDSVIGK